jgi:hypothetical protein
MSGDETPPEPVASRLPNIKVTRPSRRVRQLVAGTLGAVATVIAGVLFSVAASLLSTHGIKILRTDVPNSAFSALQSGPTPVVGSQTAPATPTVTVTMQVPPAGATVTVTAQPHPTATVTELVAVSSASESSTLGAIVALLGAIGALAGGAAAVIAVLRRSQPAAGPGPGATADATKV